VNTLVFDIETVPDVELGRKLHELGDLSDADVAEVMFTKQRQLRGRDFLPPPQQRIVAISAVMRSRDGIKIFSLGDEQSPERELGLTVHAGHGLHYGNVQPIAEIPEIVELNIGHAVVAQAVFDGLAGAVSKMKALMVAARS
jgi:hypothetical protein